MSFRNKADRIRSNRNGQLALGQRAGNTADARARRGIEAELNAGQRIGRGVEVDKNGRQQVRTDATIHIDRRNRHSVVADSLRFATPVDGSQAATKAYVDAALNDLTLLGDSHYVAENSTTTGTNAGVTPVSAGASFLYSHNNVVSPTNASAVYAIVTHTGTGDTAIQLAPGYVYALDVSTRCYNAGFEVHIGYSGDITDTNWSQELRSFRFASSNVDLTQYVLLDNSVGTYTYITPRYARYSTGTTTLSSMRLHLSRLLPHYVGGYEALPLPPPTAAPVADFEGDPVSIAAGGSVQFANRSTGHVHTFLWDFGDGTSSALNAQENPLKSYARAGTYTVSLTVTGDGGNDTETKTSYITVT